MLDIHFIRNHAHIIKEAARKKRVDVDIDELLRVDDTRREVLQKVESLRAEQNEASKHIATAPSHEAREQLLSEMRALKAELQKHEDELKEVMTTWRSLMMKVPNVPDISVPEGESEDDNVQVATWGTIPEFDFEVRDHIELMTALDMVDFERGTKVHGFRGYFLKNKGAELSWALWNYAREFFGKRNFEHVLAPTLIRKPYFYATGHLPAEAEDLYVTQDEDYLAGTSEVPMMAYYADEILGADILPKRYLSFSPCFRREAGSHSKDTKGLIRVHEFYKLEQVVLCEARHDISAQIHEEITRNFEEFLESLELPYQRLNICTGDLSASKVKQYDIEAWFPSQEQYRELASASYFHDFQTRRFNVRYTDADGKKRFAHSLNNTAIATPRVLVAIVENFQQSDGSIRIPEALRPYMGGDEFISSS